MAELKLLRCFDYLSTVSGGGYIHQWLAAWSNRRGFEEVESQLIPLPEMGNPGSHPEPIRWLRRYSNYLTPQKGMLTADTWVAFAIWLRNALLNQIILLSGLLFLAIFLHAIALPQIIPHEGWAIAIIAGAASCLSLMTIYFLGENFWRIRSEDAGGESVVQNRLVVPLTSAAFLLTLLFPAISSGSFGFHFFLAWNWSGAVLLLLALTIIFAGHVPLCYLQTHTITSHVTTVKEFWNAPKCSEHLKFILAIVTLILTMPVIGQTETDAAYFQRRLVEARQGDAGAQDDVGTLGFPPGDGAARVFAVALNQLWVAVDGEKELVEEVLAHAFTPFGYQVKYASIVWNRSSVSA